MQTGNALARLAIVALATAALGAAAPADAAVSAFLSAGPTCGGGALAQYSPGVTSQVSVCVSTTTEQLCGVSYRFIPSDASENDRFNLVARALAPAYNFSNSTNVVFPAPIETPAHGDLGSLTPTNFAAPAGAGQLIATFDIVPQSSATNTSYAIALDPILAAAFVDGGDGKCGAMLPIVQVPLAANFTFAKAPGVPPPAPIVFTSTGPGNATVGQPYQRTFTSSTAGVAYSLTSGALPPGLTLSSAGVLSGTPTTAGTFTGTVTASNNNVNPSSSQTITIFVASASGSVAPGNYQGVWFAGPADNGWGVSLVQHQDRLVAGWYFYGPSGTPVWVIMPGCTWTTLQTSPVQFSCSGTLYASTGAPFTNYNPAAFSQFVAGSATFTFTAGQPGSGHMSWNVNGTQGNRAIQQLSFGSGTAPSSIDYSDVWFAENGWGLAIFHDRATLTFAWYTYDAQGNPTWMILGAGSFTSANVYQARVMRATGSPLLGTTYNAAAYNAQDVGSATLTFSDANTATFTYTVDGVTQTKAISRLAF